MEKAKGRFSGKGQRLLMLDSPPAYSPRHSNLCHTLCLPPLSQKSCISTCYKMYIIALQAHRIMPPKLTLIIPKKMCPYRLFIYMACGHTVLVPLDRFWPSDTAPCQLSFRTKPELFSKETPNVHLFTTSSSTNFVLHVKPRGIVDWKRSKPKRRVKWLPTQPVRGVA